MSPYEVTAFAFKPAAPSLLDSLSFYETYPYAWRTYSPDLKKKALFFTPSAALFQMDTGYLVFPENSDMEKIMF